MVHAPPETRSGSAEFDGRTGLSIFAEPIGRCSDAQDGGTPFRLPSGGALIHCVLTALAGAEGEASDQRRIFAALGAILPRRCGGPRGR